MSHPHQYTPEVFIPIPCTLGEGPIWCHDRLWWVDIPEQRLLSVDQTRADHREYLLPSQIGCVAPVDASTMAVALEDGFHLLDLKTQGVSPLGQRPPHDPDIRFNDGKCDAAGRFVAGTLHMAGGKNQASLFSLAPDGTLDTLIHPLGLSNGLAWNEHSDTLYFIDSPTRSVQAFDYDLESGAISGSRTLFSIPTELGIPDGMEIDREGHLWIAHWGGWAVRRWSLEGEILAEIKTPCSQPTSCCFGGPSLDRLYITSARSGLSPEKLQEQPLAGCVFACELPGISGYPVRPFNRAVPAPDERRG